jgi:putative transcriptional regulator
MEIECRLKVIMAERGIKQKWLAERVGVSMATLSQLSNNKTLPTLPVAYRIAEELDLNVMEIWRIKKADISQP